MDAKSAVVITPGSVRLTEKQRIESAGSLSGTSRFYADDVTPEKMERARYLAKKGWQVSTIATYVGLSTGDVRRAQDEAGVTNKDTILYWEREPEYRDK